MLDSWSSAIYSFVGWSQSTSPIYCLYHLNDQLYLVNFFVQNCGTYIRYRLYNRNRLLSRNYEGRLDFAICQGDPLILSNYVISHSIITVRYPMRFSDICSKEIFDFCNPRIQPPRTCIPLRRGFNCARLLS